MQCHASNDVALETSDVVLVRYGSNDVVLVPMRITPNRPLVHIGNGSKSKINWGMRER